MEGRIKLPVTTFQEEGSFLWRARCYISKPFSSLHAHGQRPADSQPLFTPWLAKSLNPQQHDILDLLKKFQRPPRFVPGAEISPNRGVPEGFGDSLGLGIESRRGACKV
jgi:hypothetical protein